MEAEARLEYRESLEVMNACRKEAREMRERRDRDKKRSKSEAKVRQERRFAVAALAGDWTATRGARQQGGSGGPRVFERMCTAQ